jgi:hypothetical protein
LNTSLPIILKRKKTSPHAPEKKKVLQLTSITKTVTHHHPFYLETNAMLVSHGGKEHILNAEIKK